MLRQNIPGLGGQPAPEIRAPVGLAMERLIGLLREENTALRDMDFGRAGSLLQAKYAAAGALEAAFRAGEMDMSGETTDTLNSLALENKALLQRAERIQKRVFSLVSRVADRRRPTGTTRPRVSVS